MNVRTAPDAPISFVFHMYGTNQHYVLGRPTSASASNPHPFPDLHRIYTDRSNLRADHRRSAIECQLQVDLPFDNRLYWIAYPQPLTDLFTDIRINDRFHRPECWAYPYKLFYDPAALAEMLQHEAQKQMRAYLEE